MCYTLYTQYHVHAVAADLDSRTCESFMREEYVGLNGLLYVLMD